MVWVFAIVAARLLSCGVCSTFVRRQSVRAPPILMRNGSEQGDREGIMMKVEPVFQDVADHIRLFSLLVYAIEGIPCSIHWQYWDVEDLAFRRNGRDSRCNTETHRLQTAQLFH